MLNISDEELASLINELPIQRSWQHMICVILDGSPSKTAHVSTIAREVRIRFPYAVVDSLEETITATLIDSCENSKNADKKPSGFMFRRVEPATYQLRKRFSVAEDLVGQRRVAWEDKTIGYLWLVFGKKRKATGDGWGGLPLSQRLAQFAVYLRQPRVQERLKRLREDLNLYHSVC